MSDSSPSAVSKSLVRSRETRCSLAPNVRTSSRSSRSSCELREDTRSAAELAVPTCVSMVATALTAASPAPVWKPVGSAGLGYATFDERAWSWGARRPQIRSRSLCFKLQRAILQLPFLLRPRLPPGRGPVLLSHLPHGTVSIACRNSDRADHVTYHSILPLSEQMEPGPAFAIRVLISFPRSPRIMKRPLSRTHARRRFPPQPRSADSPVHTRLPRY